jgi:hypothetical protein
MRKVMHKVMAKARRQHRRHMNFLKALRLFEGMPLFGLRSNK